MANLLTKQQLLALKLISETELAKQFYFSEGTVLTYFYLQHRKSEDLDFFSLQEFDPQSIAVILKSLQQKLGFQTFDYQSSFNRNLFFLKFADGYVLKLEFTYYPFKQVEEPTLKEGLMVDSAIDIAVNKLFTIVQKPRGRDYFDLFALIKKYGYKIEQLRMLAKQKFDWHVDPLQLAARLNEADMHLDDPILTKGIERKEMTSFFEQAASKLKSEILEK